MAVELTRTKVRAGVWEGMLTGTAKPPLLSVTHLSTQVAGAEITPVPGAPGQYLVRVPIPVELLADGVQTFVISDAATDERLASFTVATGAAMDDDIRAELTLLREELDMLKRAFRRHCVETM
ncbi:MAG: hypothetical protein KDK10_06030 [Maritimibacter sp.]|nr:hypothetical protein [Maritimibacter sp.]